MQVAGAGIPILQRLAGTHDRVHPVRAASLQALHVRLCRAPVLSYASSCCAQPHSSFNQLILRIVHAAAIYTCRHLSSSLSPAHSFAFDPVTMEAVRDPQRFKKPFTIAANVVSLACQPAAAPDTVFVLTSSLTPNIH